MPGFTVLDEQAPGGAASATVAGHEIRCDPNQVWCTGTHTDSGVCSGSLDLQEEEKGGKENRQSVGGVPCGCDPAGDRGQYV